MITNTGKSILAKYLIGQAPAYASYIAVGCGAKPISGNLGDYSEKENLDFEMFRVPITSRGYVTENDVSKIVLTAELPTEERYEISEVGVYSAGSNPYSGASDNKLLYSFAGTEGWEYHNSTLAIEIPTIVGPLDGTNNDNIISQTSPVFQTNADNRIFTNQSRIDRHERCRFLNNTIMMAGNDADLDLVDSRISVTSGNHIHLTGTTIDLSKSSPKDEIRLAFSVIDKNGSAGTNPDIVRILLEFASTDVHNESGAQYARFEVDVYDENYGSIPSGAMTEDFSTNRYLVVNKKIEELIKSSGFTWGAIDVVKVYASVIKDGSPSSAFYVGLDAIRLERIANQNPLYGLTGYSVIKNADAQTIIKSTNTTNYIEFRFALDVQ